MSARALKASTIPTEKGDNSSKAPVDPGQKTVEEFLSCCRSVCSLFNQISDKLDGECPFDVSDQALALLVMTSTVESQDKISANQSQGDDGSTFKAELQKLIGFVDNLLAMEEVKRLEESKDMEKLNSSLVQFGKETCLKISGSPMPWAVNVLNLIELNYKALQNDSYIMNCPTGDLIGLQRRTEQLWEYLLDELNIAKSDEISFVKSLQLLGYSRAASDENVSSIPNPWIERQSSLFWSVRYLRYKLFNEPLLTCVPRYPYKEGKINDWFLEAVEDTEDESEIPRTVQVKMINMSNGSGQKQVESFLKDLEKVKGAELFFHGTSHSDAMLILMRGVELSMGSPGQDFSSGDGFYLAVNLEDARQWAGAGRGKYQAVIVFKVSLSGQAGGLSLVGGSDQWQKIVSLCRGQYENYLQKTELLKNVKYIRGPACRNPISALQNKTKFEDDKNSQLCIRDTSLVKSHFNTKNICCVIFY